jgi:antitoxin component YwqK of YwqJK toxin-antitoxin module
MRSKIIVIFLALLLLAGCTNEEIKPDDEPKGGTVIITVNPVIAVTYDAQGDVTDVTAVSEDAVAIVESYSSYIGKDCTEVVSDLVNKIGQAGYLEKDAQIRVTFEEESEKADEIAEDIAARIEQIIEESDYDVTVEVEIPEQSKDTTSEPEEDTTTKPNVPDGAEVYDDGTYSIKDYLNKQLTEVEKDRAVYVRTTVYRPDHRILSQDIWHIETDKQYRITINRYDGDALVSTATRQYDKNGNFKEHYEEFLDSTGAIVKKVEYDRLGEIQLQTLYSYYASGQKSQVQTANGQGVKKSEQNYYENGQLHTEILFHYNGQHQSVTEYDEEGKTLHSTGYYDNGSTKSVETYVDGVRRTVEWYNEDGTRASYTEYWDNGQVKFRQSVGFFYNDERINGLCESSYTEEGIPVKDALYWPDGTLHMENCYYPSGNIKSQYICDPSNSYNPEYFGEHRDGEAEAYKGWNIIDGEKVYFNLDQG